MVCCRCHRSVPVTSLINKFTSCISRAVPNCVCCLVSSTFSSLLACQENSTAQPPHHVTCKPCSGIRQHSSSLFSASFQSTKNCSKASSKMSSDCVSLDALKSSPRTVASTDHAPWKSVCAATRTTANLIFTISCVTYFWNSSAARRSPCNAFFNCHTTPCSSSSPFGRSAQIASPNNVWQNATDTSRRQHKLLLSPLHRVAAKLNASLTHRECNWRCDPLLLTDSFNSSMTCPS